MNFGVLLVVQRNVQSEHHVLRCGNVRTRLDGHCESIASLTTLLLALAQEQEALGRLQVVVKLVLRTLLHRRNNLVLKFLDQRRLRLLVLRGIDLLHRHCGQERPGLHVFRVGVCHLLEQIPGRRQLVLHHRHHRQFDFRPLTVAGILCRALQVFEGLLAVAVHQLQPHHADQRIMVLGVLRQDGLVDLTRLGLIVLARIQGGHHVEEHRPLVRRDEVNGAADLGERVARTARTGPGMSETDKRIGIADVAVVGAKTPQEITAVLVFDSRLEHALQLTLFCNRLGVLLSDHGDLVEDGADVIMVDLVQDELIHLERLVVFLLILQVDATVVGDEAEVAAQGEAHPIDGIRHLAVMVAAPALRRLQNRVELLPGGPIGDDFVVRTEEEELRHRRDVSRIPQVRRTEHGDVLGDGRIGREPVLDERQHAQRQRQPKRAVAGTADTLGLDDFRQFLQVFRIQVLGQRNDVEVLAGIGRHQLQMIVQSPIRDEPTTGPKIRDDLARDLVGKRPRIPVKGKEVPHAGYGEHERQNHAGNQCNGLTAVDPPVGDKIAADGGGKRTRKNGQDSIRLHQRGRRERRRHSQDRHEGHRGVKDPLNETRFLDEGPSAGKQRHHKRQRREKRDEHPSEAAPVPLHFLGDMLQNLQHVDAKTGSHNPERQQCGQQQQEPGDVRTRPRSSRNEPDKRNISWEKHEEDCRIAQSHCDHEAKRQRE